MAAEAIECSFDVVDSTQTKMVPFNLEKIREFGEAMMFGAGKRFGQNDECNTRSVVMFSSGQSNDLAHWVSQDFKNNSKLLEILTVEIATDHTEDSNYIFNSERISQYSQKAFNDDITSMLTSISECMPLVSSESTISLAKRIAAMGNEEVDIEGWADKLAGDISKGRD